MGTYIDGIAASENIDTSGEVLSMKGMDISSLVGSVFNWEHKSDTPDQIVGKILQAKKIFSEKDCENERHQYYWNKCKTPFLYAMGMLFDDYKESAKEVAGLFKFDAAERGKHPMDTVGFSIEGAKIAKEGNIVTHSIARKITCTQIPCNKAAVAEMIPAEKPKQKNDLDSLFKTEPIEIELFKNDGGAGVPGASGLALSEEKLKKAAPGLKLAGPNGFHIGQTASGKDIHSHGRIGEYKGFDENDHMDAAALHQKASDSTINPEVKRHHAGKAQLHRAAADKLGLIRADRKLRTQAMATAATPTVSANPSVNKQSNKLFHPDRSGTMAPPGPKKPGIAKALDAGSGLAAPNQLTQGAALAKESLEKGSVNPALAPKERKIKELQAKIDAGTYKPDAAKIAEKMKNHPEKPLGKAELQRPKARGTTNTGTIKPTGTTEFFHNTGKNTPVGKMLREQDLKAFKQQPKPSLPKSEEMMKARIDEGKTPDQKRVDRSKRKYLGWNETHGHETHEKGIHATTQEKGKSRMGFANRMAKEPYIQSSGKKYHQNEAKKQAKRVLGEIKAQKSEALMRAEQEYQNWGKREEFEKFMKSRMPHLTKGEIVAIGQAMVLNKSFSLEKTLKKLIKK